MNQIKDKKYWDKIVEDSPNYNIFSKSFFLDLWYKNYNLYEIKNKNQTLVSIVLGKKNFSSLNSTFPYQSIIYSNGFYGLKNHSKYNKNIELINFFLEKNEKLGIFFKFSLHPNIKDIRPFLWHNYNSLNNKNKFKIDIRYTAILNFENNNLEKIVSQFRSARKEDLKKFKKKNYTVETSKDIKILDYLHKRTFERQKKIRSENEIHLVNIIAKKMILKNYATMLVSKDGKKPISAVVVVYDKKTGYYFVGANDFDYRNSGANTALLCEHFNILIKKGIKNFDFMGVNSPLRGDFKLSFNPNLYPYFNINIK